MRRPGRFVGWLSAAVLLGWGLSWAMPRIPGALDDLDWFRVRNLRVEGLRYLSTTEVKLTAAVPEATNLWDDTAPVAARLRAHPLIRAVEVSRRLPGTLVVEVEERVPVGLVPTPTLQPVDRDGHRLPLDPSRRSLDLPVIRPGHAVRGAPAPAAIAAAAGEAARLAEVDPTFWAGISAVTEVGLRDVVLEWGDPAVRLHYRIPLSQVRMREALAVLADAADRAGGHLPATLDLRFTDQVVVRWGGLD
ncbi:MAG TPA: hypothetical protein DIU18_04335 [Gemmatimonadetes bacterium]|nr:hypothetical protein [Gemmatimonadota bacterium]